MPWDSAVRSGGSVGRTVDLGDLPLRLLLEDLHLPLDVRHLGDLLRLYERHDEQRTNEWELLVLYGHNSQREATGMQRAVSAPMTARLRSVSASFSTTRWRCVAIISFVFSASLRDYQYIEPSSRPSIFNHSLHSTVYTTVQWTAATCASSEQVAVQCAPRLSESTSIRRRHAQVELVGK